MTEHRRLHPMLVFKEALDLPLGLSPRALSFARIIGWLIDSNGTCFPGRTYLKKHGIGQDGYRQALAELEHVGLISCQSRKGPHGANLVISNAAQLLAAADGVDRSLARSLDGEADEPADASGRSLTRSLEPEQRTGPTAQRTVTAPSANGLGRPEHRNIGTSSLVDDTLRLEALRRTDEKIEKGFPVENRESYANGIFKSFNTGGSESDLRDRVQRLAAERPDATARDLHEALRDGQRHSGDPIRPRPPACDAPGCSYLGGAGPCPIHHPPPAHPRLRGV